MKRLARKWRYGVKVKSSLNDFSSKECENVAVRLIQRQRNAKISYEICKDVQDLLEDCCLRICQTENSQNDFCNMESDKIEKVVQNVLQECCIKVCQTLKEKEYKDNAMRININSLPVELLFSIFNYLDYSSFCVCKGVCRSWYEITKSSTFFKGMYIEIRRERGGLKIPEIIYERLSTLPNSLSHLSVTCDRRSRWSVEIYDFSKKIRELFPYLHTLVLHKMNISISGKYFDIGMLMPKNTRVLVLNDCHFLYKKISKYAVCDIPKIEVLDLCNCKGMFIYPNRFKFLPYLKKLRFSGCITMGDFKSIFTSELRFKNFEAEHYTNTEDIYFEDVVKMMSRQLETLDFEFTFINSLTFHNICHCCTFLKELFICFTPITDEHLIFKKPKTVLPSLKTLCLRNCKVTVKGVSSFLKVCPSLNHVYVGAKDEDPADGFSSCDLPKVSLLTGYKHCKHYQEVDYMFIN